MKTIKTILILPVLTCLLITLACSGGKRQKNTLSFVSFDEELRLGEQLASQARVILPLVRNQEILTFLDSLACELGRVSDWDGLAYRVYLVNKPDYNHFSLPGGHIFLFRGLLERCRSIDQIAVVIAHEIAHVAHRHSVGRLSEKYAFSFAAQSVIGENPEIAAEIINSLYAEGTILDYPEEWEHLADEKALEYTWKADYNPAGLVQVLEHGIDLQLNNPENVELLNRTHPSASSRLKRVRMHLALIPAKANLRTESAEFDRIQEVLKKIR